VYGPPPLVVVITYSSASVTAAQVNLAVLVPILVASLTVGAVAGAAAFSAIVVDATLLDG